MASLYRRARSPFWWVKFRDHRGRVARVSTRTDDEQLAREMAADLEEAATIARTGRGALKMGGLARLVELGYLTSDVLLPEDVSPDADTRRLDILAEASPVARAEKRTRPGDYKAHMARLREFMAWASIERIDQLTPATVRSWIEHLVDEDLTTNQIQHRLRYLRAAAHYAPEHGYPNPLGPIKMPRSSARSAELATLTLEEIQKLLTSRLPVRHQIAIGFMGALGLRHSELCRLQWQDIRGDVVCVGAWARKNDPANRFLPIPKQLLALLEEHRANRLAYLKENGIPEKDMSPAIFARRHARERGAVCIRATSRAIKRALQEVLPGTKATGSSLRKSFSTIATWEVGIPPEVVDAFMGRRVSGLGPTTARHYTGKARADRLRGDGQKVADAMWGTRAGHTKGHTRRKSKNVKGSGRPSKP